MLTPHHAVVLRTSVTPQSESQAAQVGSQHVVMIALGLTAVLAHECLMQVGLASLTMNVQRAGGSTQHPDGVLDEALEGLAASIDMGAGAQVRVMQAGVLG